MKKFSPTELQAWVDGQLDAGRAREVEAEVASDPESRAFCDNLRALRHELRQHEPIRTVPETREFYWSKIRRGIEEAGKAAAREQERSRPPARPMLRWLLWFAPAAAFAVAAVFFLRSAGDRPAGTEISRANPPTSISGHKIEAPDVGLTTLTFYSAQESMTVVWLGKMDVL